MSKYISKVLLKMFQECLVSYSTFYGCFLHEAKKKRRRIFLLILKCFFWQSQKPYFTTIFTHQLWQIQAGESQKNSKNSIIPPASL